MKKKLFTGLPIDIEEAVKEVSKEAEKIIIRAEKRSYGKIVTLVEGIDPSIAKETLKKLKTKLGCGGTYKEGIIELQGDHREKVRDLLIEMGYNKNNIEIVSEIY